MNTSFTLDAKYLDILAPLSDAELGQLTRALLLYAKDRSQPSFSDRALLIAFRFISADIDHAAQLREARCQRNRENARKRWAKRPEPKAPKSAPAQTARPEPEPAGPAPEAATGHAAVNCDKLIAYWNSRIDATHSAMPKINSITSQRRSLLNARLNEYGGSTATLRDAFERAFRSPWLNGKNKNRWVADFNWILQPANFSRVLEGTFDSRDAAVPQPSAPLPPVPEISPEERRRREAEAKDARDQRLQQSRRDTLLSAIKAAKRNPNGTAAKVVAQALADGTLSSLGLDFLVKSDPDLKIPA